MQHLTFSVLSSKQTDMKLLFVFLVFLASSRDILASQKVRFDGFKVYSLTPKTKEAAESLRTLENYPNGYDFWTPVRGVGYPVHIMVPPHLNHQFNDITKSGKFYYEVYIPDVQKLIDNEKTGTRIGAEFGWTDYHTLDEINGWLASLAESNPETVTLLNGGTSYEGRNITGVRVSFAPGNEKRSVFIEANIHAREWISSAVATWILNQLLTSEDPNVRQVAESHDWYIFPVFNPDGFEYTHTTNRMWRKTRVPYMDGACYGADPNRNWDFHFNDGGSSPIPCMETYSGPEAFSEPCTKTLSNFISTIAPDLLGYIAFHSFSQLMLIPYGYSSEHLDNYQDLYDVGLKSAASLAQRYGTEFQVGNIVDILYVASGGSMDWVKGTFGTPITYTYELRDTGRYGFILPPDQIIPSSEEILDSLVTMFQEFDKIIPPVTNHN